VGVGDGVAEDADAAGHLAHLLDLVGADEVGRVGNELLATGLLALALHAAHAPIAVEQHLLDEVRLALHVEHVHATVDGAAAREALG
jgi:hypothetical protein